MRVEASKVLEKIAYKLKVRDPLAGGSERISKLAEIEENALAFAEDFLVDYEFPSAPVIKLGCMHGFENVQTPLDKVIGVVSITAEFKTQNGIIVRLDFPVPISRGSFHKPSIVVHGGKKYIFSTGFLNNLVNNLETSKIKVMSPLQPSQHFQHAPNIQKSLFSAPEDSTGWGELITERYI